MKLHLLISTCVLSLFSLGSIANTNTAQISITQLEKQAKQGDIESQFAIANEYYLGENVDQDLKLALYWYKQVAIAGYASAQFNVANSYYNGIGTEQDIDRAMIWYEKAAKQGVSAAAYNLGVIHFDKNQHKQGIFWYETAARDGYILAQLNLAKIYTDGVLVTKNLITAENWYQQAVQTDNPVAEYEYGWFLENQSRMAEAVKYYQKSAAAGYFKAQYQLAYLHRIAKGVKQDNERAYELLTQAVSQDFAPAQYLLGVVYKTYKKDLENAIKWYKKAAANNNQFAQYSLGVAYLKGEGVEKNVITATEYFIKSAEAGYSNAQYSLAIRYLTGKGIAQNYEEAIKWLERAASQQHPYAHYSLSLRYKLGQGVEQDKYKRIYHLEQAYQFGNKEAEYELAVLAIGGTKTSIAPETAVSLLKTLAPNHKSAGYELGKKLINTDVNEAKIYLTHAVNNNNASAKQLLALLENRSTSLPKKVSMPTIAQTTNTPAQNTTTQDLVATATSVATNTPIQPEALPRSGDLKLAVLATENGDVIAQYRLAQAYLSGNGVAKNIPKGLQLLTQSAKEEYPLAQYDLGILYRDGVIIEQNIQLAYYWTIKALQNNYIPANEILTSLQNLVN